MRVRRRKVDAGLERQFLRAMVTSKAFLATVAPELDLTLVPEEHFRLVAGWCVDHWNSYHDVPNGELTTRYHVWAEGQDGNEDRVDAVHDLLEYLSREQEQAVGEVNVQYLVDEMGRYMTRMKLMRLRDHVDAAIEQGSTDEAEHDIATYTSVRLGEKSGTSLRSRSLWERAFADPLEPLLRFPEPANRFFDRAFTRDALVAIQGPEKRGKTWWCVELVIRALRARRKVAMFEVGDLSESQLALRFGVRLAARPLWESQCGSVDVPKRIKVVGNHDGETEYSLQHTAMGCPRTVSQQSARRAMAKLLRDCGIPRGEPYEMISAHPNSSINVRGITAILDRWERQLGFIPDVIVIDYADILDLEDPRQDSRHQINDTWKALRRLSQERHCLVIVPTQADAASYTAKTQTMKNFSWDKRKMAHVTGMLGLNQTENEKSLGVMRLNWIVLRESEFNTGRCLHVAQCLPLGRAYCCSTF